MDEFTSLLKEFLNSQVLVYALYVYLFALVFYTVYSMLNYFKYYSRMKARVQTLYNQMDEREKARADEERRQRDIHGAGGHRDFLAVLDEQLAYSGIKDVIKWMTTEIFLMITIVVLTIVLVIMTLATNLIIAIVVDVILGVLIELVLTLLIQYRNTKTESIMLQFMNILDNFSKTSDDLISILEKTSRYIEEPLSSQIYDACIAAKNSGDSMSALQELQDRVKNKHFKVLIRNLEISSRYETNYSDIVDDCRDLFHDYIRSEKEKRNIRVNGLLEIALMYFCGWMCMSLMGSLTEDGNMVLSLMNGGILGQGILAFLIFAIVASAYVAVFKVLRGN